MKDIKSFLIGFLSCVCLFLFIGATSNDGLLYKLDEIHTDLKNQNTWVNAVCTNLDEGDCPDCTCW